MGWDIDDFHGLKHVSHGGATLGQVSYLAFLPDADLGIVILTNHFLAAITFRNAVEEYIYELAFDLEHTADARYYGLHEEFLRQLSQARDMFPVRPITADEAAEFVGTYEPGGSITINDAGELLLQTAFDEPIHFLAVDGEEGTFIGTGAMSLVTLRFEVDNAGQVTALLSTLIDDMQGTPPSRLAKIDLRNAQSQLNDFIPKPYTSSIISILCKNRATLQHPYGISLNHERYVGFDRSEQFFNYFRKQLQHRSGASCQSRPAAGSHR